jgi:hypothetical protein
MLYARENEDLESMSKNSFVDAIKSLLMALLGFLSVVLLMSVL